MLIWNVDCEDLLAAIKHVSDTYYEGNLCVRYHPEKKGFALQWTLTVEDSAGPGHRLSVGDRVFNPQRKPKRLRAACWHAHYDVMSYLFRLFPDARLTSGRADYHGREDFANEAMATGEINVGSQLVPVRFDESCECEDWCPVCHYEEGK